MVVQATNAHSVSNLTGHIVQSTKYRY